MHINNIKRLNVFLDIESSSHFVGTLIEEQGKIYFEYDTAFSQSKLEISPFYLPLKNLFYNTPWPKEFFGLPGVFYGSLPDGWGLLLMDKNNHQAMYGVGNLPENYEHYIIKFNAQNEQRTLGIVEYIYSLMAREAGVNITDTQLIKVDKDYFFAIKRFDRINNKKLHTHTLAGVIHSDYRLPELSYDHLLRVTMGLTHNQGAVEAAFRQMLFNIMAYNRDDHAKNFSFIMNAHGKWSLSPAYDLLFSNGINGWHTLSVGSGQQINPKIREVYELAENFNINQKTV